MAFDVPRRFIMLVALAALPRSASAQTGPGMTAMSAASTQAAVTVSYSPSLIDTSWSVYRADRMDTGRWAIAAGSFRFTGSVSSSFGLPLSSNAFIALGREGVDGDRDGLDDAFERLSSGTDPARADTDGDGVTDGEELTASGTDPRLAGSHPTQTILRASGTAIVDASGRPVALRGVNLGSWLAYERWMVNFRPATATEAEDDYQVRATLTSRFNSTGMVTLLDTFRDHYLTANDLDDLKALGMNFVRVPFVASVLEDDASPYVYKPGGWARLDWVVSNCAARQMYCLLDMHGAPGSQNPWDHSGRKDFNQFWSNAVYRDRAAAMWVAIARRYATNPAVAGYDLLNEPFQDVANQPLFVTNTLVPIYDRLYKAIRSNDTAHLIFIESTEQLIADTTGYLPVPAAKGWSNVVYEFHRYDGVIGGPDVSFAYQKSVADELARRYVELAQTLNVPVYVGEMNPVAPQNTDYWLRQFGASGIAWTPWNYRHWGEWTNALEPWSSWGLSYRREGSNNWLRPHVATDTWDNLVTKLSLYDHSQYELNPYLSDLYARVTAVTPEANQSEVYVNTFSAHGQDNRRSPDDAWPWAKLEMMGGNDSSYVLTNHHGRLVVDYMTNLCVRLKSRPEATARFRVNDSTGCWFSVELDQLGTNSGVQLLASCDATADSIWNDSSPAVIVRAVASASTRHVQVLVYTKTRGTLGFGSNVYTSDWLTFSNGAALALFVNSTSAAAIYNTSNLWTGAHGLDLSQWPAGAACEIEADNLSGGTTPRTWVELDTIRAWRPGAGWSPRFDDDFASHPDRLALLAAPERWAALDFGADESQAPACFESGGATNGSTRMSGVLARRLPGFVAPE